MNIHLAMSNEELAKAVTEANKGLLATTAECVMLSYVTQKRGLDCPFSHFTKAQKANIIGFFDADTSMLGKKGFMAALNKYADVKSQVLLAKYDHVKDAAGYAAKNPSLYAYFKDINLAKKAKKEALELKKAQERELEVQEENKNALAKAINVSDDVIIADLKNQLAKALLNVEHFEGLANTYFNECEALRAQLAAPVRKKVANVV